MPIICTLAISEKMFSVAMWLQRQVFSVCVTPIGSHLVHRHVSRVQILGYPSWPAISASAPLNQLLFWPSLETCVVYMESPIYWASCLPLCLWRFLCEYSILWDPVLISANTTLCEQIWNNIMNSPHDSIHIINANNLSFSYPLWLTIGEAHYFPSAITYKVTRNHTAATLYPAWITVIICQT